MSLLSARASYIEKVLFLLPGMDNKEVTSFEQFSWIVIDLSINILLKYSPYKYDTVLWIWIGYKRQRERKIRRCFWIFWRQTIEKKKLFKSLRNVTTMKPKLILKSVS